MIRRYFDWAATAPDSPSPLSAVPFGNPSSRHLEGRRAHAALEEARARAASVLGVKAEQLFWTSGGTEANTIALFAPLRRLKKSQGSILVGATEHPSIRANLPQLAAFGIPVETIGVERWGAVSPETLRKAFDKQPKTHLAAIMHVNNETGALADVPTLVRTARKQAGEKLRFHCDMVQSAGKIPFSLTEFDVDSASFAAHKLGGPRGIGLLYLKSPLEPLISGGLQERGIRPGTENVAGALGFAACLEQRTPDTSAEDRMAQLITGLTSHKRCVIIPEDRRVYDSRFSPYILQTAFMGLSGEVIVRVLDDEGFAVSTSSACSSSEKKRPVLDAMGIPQTRTFESIRISQGWSTTSADIDALLEAIYSLLKRF
ncbi:MAG: aminotransferase class V-fold PLP-dependent enzyme [Spirochaetaceae bacterium]|jgi:cysteine desulfurase|nr:aminotransferase class V-fold PLP-dependent enzyme [Spirochaetaceae bacterium]